MRVGMARIPLDLDDRDLLDNPSWRGITLSHLQWMFTPHKDYYRPLAWVTHGLDYCLWGMNPAGHHLTSLLIHVANAVFFYLICRRVLALASPVSCTRVPELTCSRLTHRRAVPLVQ